MNAPFEPVRSRNGEAYLALRGAIMSGELAPGSRLGPADLASRYGFGLTPIREALARLAAENLAIAIEQKGFRVTPLLSSDLAELLSLRLGFERDALLISMARGGDSWEAGIVAATHLLLKCEVPHPAITPAALAAWSQRHDAFHAALIAGADTPWLRRFRQITIAQIERYRLAILRRHRDPSGGPVVDSSVPPRLRQVLSHEAHLALRDAALGRDADLAERRLASHVNETKHVFMDMFETQNA